jgi:hypothetical protein
MYNITAHVTTVQLPQNLLNINVGVGDINSDGHQDVIYTGFVFPHAFVEISPTVLLNNAAGGFNYAPGFLPTTAVTTRELIVEDFNNDGANDYFFANHGYDVNPFPGEADDLALFNPLSGGFDATDWLQANGHANSANPSFTHSAATADVNGDGFKDTRSDDSTRII